MSGKKQRWATRWWEKVPQELTQPRPEGSRLQELTKSCQRAYQAVIVASLVASVLNYELNSFFYTLVSFGEYRKLLEDRVVTRTSGYWTRRGPGDEVIGLYSVHDTVRNAVEARFPGHSARPFGEMSSACLWQGDKYIAATTSVIKSMTVEQIISSWRQGSHFAATPEALVKAYRWGRSEKTPRPEEPILYTVDADCETMTFELRTWQTPSPYQMSDVYDLTVRGSLSELYEFYSDPRPGFNSHLPPYLNSKSLSRYEAIEKHPYYSEVRDMTPAVANSYVADRNLSEFRQKRSSLSLLGTPVPTFGATFAVLLGLCLNLLVRVHELSRAEDVLRRSETAWLTLMSSSVTRWTATILIAVLPIVATTEAAFASWLESSLSDVANSISYGDAVRFSFFTFGTVTIPAFLTPGTALAILALAAIGVLQVVFVRRLWQK